MSDIRSPFPLGKHCSLDFTPRTFDTFRVGGRQHVHCNGGPDRVCVEGRHFCAREALLLLKCTAVTNTARARRTGTTTGCRVKIDGRRQNKNIHCTGPPDRMSHRKWRSTNEQPSRARAGYQISCCLRVLSLISCATSCGVVLYLKELRARALHQNTADQSMNQFTDLRYKSTIMVPPML